MNDDKRIVITSDNHNNNIGRSISFDNISSLNNNRSSNQIFLDDTRADISRRLVNRQQIEARFTSQKLSYSNGNVQDIIDPPDKNHLLLGLDVKIRNKLNSMDINKNNSTDKNERLISHKIESPTENPQFQSLLDNDMSQNNNEVKGFSESQLEDELFDEENFTNVDEIDGPIAGQILPPLQKSDKSKLKEPVGLTDATKDHDFNMPIDSGLQESLERRASEIGSSTIDSMAEPIPKIEVNYLGSYNLEEELPMWFSLSDYTYLPQTKSQFKQKNIDKTLFMRDVDYARLQIKVLVNGLSTNLQTCIMALLFICLGIDKSNSTTKEQVLSIKRNIFLLLEDENNLITIVKRFYDISNNCRDKTSNLNLQTTLFFYTMTIIFLIATVCIEERFNEARKPIIDNTINIFEDMKLLLYLVKYIEHWRWNSRLSMKIRNIINLLSKVIILQFGDDAVFKKTKREIYKLHKVTFYEDEEENITESANCIKSKLGISPLSYEAFREDIISRYPDLVIPNDKLPNSIDNSNSLSQFIEIPRSKIRNSMNQLLSMPNQHLATPAPSPPGSPTLSPISPLQKQRRSFQTNMSFPCLYPSDDESGTDDLTKRLSFMGDFNVNDNTSSDITIPYSISEATQILNESLRVGLCNKQLWYERDLFMMKERGWKSKIDDNPYDYITMKNSNNIEGVDIMKRVENFYKDCFPSLNSLIFVLIQIMESNVNNLCYNEVDVRDKIPLDVLIPKLEVTRAKEIALRSSTGIIYDLLKWFKLNHVLKYEHLCVLLYDSQYINTSTLVLNNYSEIYVDRLFKKTASSNHSIWIELQALAGNLSTTTEKATYNFDPMILSSFTYMFNTLSHITRDKTQRLKDLPLSIGILFKRYYRVFNLPMYHAILKIVKELTPFKNKRWKAEHMDLISGVYLYERLELTENWVTGKDISNELSDACGQELALRALLQFYNFFHYKASMLDLGYTTRTNANQTLLNNESENINSL
ncbi:hypothetical protein TPHA_0I01430 [Tetrapisispora phaffii CBS 4417]|uniref:Factor arrest protein 11 n=1 Tax=Tetrapisispora phaffii (strain ATCC 24235 / CBS 4417 / NBRC 1672 / NRRL Y-8282 / UCD 70-5) TaxID=1071381 RepID=G8BXM1_TETPH|nr:hypothetical protein TPHA_0I01430 [Tetrapisispora phaffii CBS 4417]CCE64649.1 hypothetical protein TPHA_0I01430 [Tetrapisispora phaffii CBS 4417]